MEVFTQMPHMQPSGSCSIARVRGIKESTAHVDKCKCFVHV